MDVTLIVRVERHSLPQQLRSACDLAGLDNTDGWWEDCRDNDQRQLREEFP
jgi:hypothetical protein